MSKTKARGKTRAPTTSKRRGTTSAEPYDGVSITVEPREDSVADDQVVETEEVPAARVLRVAVYESPAQLAAAQHGLAAAGHALVIAGAGREGSEAIQLAMRDETIDVVIAGLPGGEAVIESALELAPARPVIVAACSGDPVNALMHAMQAGADLVTLRPHDPEHLVPPLLAALRLLEERAAMLAVRGSEVSLRERLDSLLDPEPGSLQPFEMFQRVLELEIKRARRYNYPLAVALFVVDTPPPAPPPGIRGILRARAGNAIVHSIRDIDMATEIDDDRFLVLLPYTSAAGGAEVGRRIIDAIAAAEPVVALGRAFVPQVAGGVAGVTPGEPLSFAQLMRDATRALDQARKLGIDLGVSS